VSDEAHTIHVNFARAIPLFPLEQVALLPQQVMPLHIFEPRYRQLVTDALDGAGLIAMSVFAGKGWKQQYHARPPILPAVCVGHIAQHEKLPDGRYNILLYGVCRARVVEELPPSDVRLYRAAVLEPMELDDDEDGGGGGGEDARETLDAARAQIGEMLSTLPLHKMSVADVVLSYLRNEQLPTPAVLDMVAMALASDPKVRYTLLAEGDPVARMRVLLRELHALSRLLRLATKQRETSEPWPKGLSWN
jgi:uncharacterized protein